MTEPVAGRAPTCGDAGGRNVRGAPCGRTLDLGADGRCLLHSTDPERAVRHATTRADAVTGGRASAAVRRLAKLNVTTVTPRELPEVEPDSLENLATWLRWTTRAVAVGWIDARTAGEISRALRELRPVLVSIDLEKRLREAERTLAKARQELERRDHAND